MHRIFLLSPANTAGKRARLLSGDTGGGALAERMRAGERVPIGEIFTFLSGLYFRGKAAYASRFGSAPPGIRPAYVITSNHGLLPVDEPISLSTFRAFAETPIDPSVTDYRGPLELSLRKLARYSSSCEYVLLGSIATEKYSAVLTSSLSDKVLFPVDFIGRGDMSRGGLMLRCVASGAELEYRSILEASGRRGARPPKIS